MPRHTNCPNCKCSLTDSPSGSHCAECASGRLRNDGSYEARSRAWADVGVPKARVDVDHNQLGTFLSNIARCSSGYDIVDCAVITQVGPGGGNPVVDIFGRDRDGLRKFLLDHYDPDMVEPDFALYFRAA